MTKNTGTVVSACFNAATIGENESSFESKSLILSYRLFRLVSQNLFTVFLSSKSSKILFAIFKGVKFSVALRTNNFTTCAEERKPATDSRVLINLIIAPGHALAISAITATTFIFRLRSLYICVPIVY